MSSAAQINAIQNWRKLGLIIEPQPEYIWWRGYCMAPTPQWLEGPYWRIYFSGRDARNRSHIGWAVVDLDQAGKLVEVSSEPVLAPGALGCFDDNGVTPSCVVDVAGRTFLYYIGWNPGSTTRMNIFGGLAISDNRGRTFERWSRAPILERCRIDPYINTAPFVIDDGDGWRMYYVSGVGWDDADTPRYHIKTAVSDDAKQWQRDGTVCIDFANPAEIALARPYVVREGGLWRMWFAHKGEAYRLGYAESDDGINWRRDDGLVDLDVSPDGWDSQMVEYAAVVAHDGARFMFYNGNEYGRAGIGLAVWE